MYYNVASKMMETPFQVATKAKKVSDSCPVDNYPSFGYPAFGYMAFGYPA